MPIPFFKDGTNIYYLKFITICRWLDKDEHRPLMFMGGLFLYIMLKKTSFILLRVSLTRRFIYVTIFSKER